MGWDDAVWDDGEARPPRPPAPLPFGGGRRMVEVVCCPAPACASPLVVRDGARHVGDAIAYWRCRDCGATWKEAAALGLADRRAFLT